MNYKEEIIKMIRVIKNDKILRYLYIVINDIVSEKKS